MDWINVKDRLPNKCERVLLYSNYDGVVIGEIDRYADNGDFTSNDEYEIATHRKCVTHWMPLPESPTK